MTEKSPSQLLPTLAHRAAAVLGGLSIFAAFTHHVALPQSDPAMSILIGIAGLACIAFAVYLKPQRTGRDEAMRLYSHAAHNLLLLVHESRESQNKPPTQGTEETLLPRGWSFTDIRWQAARSQAPQSTLRCSRPRHGPA